MWFKSEGKAGKIMAHIPYGYMIVDGKAVINKEKAETVRRFFEF